MTPARRTRLRLRARRCRPPRPPFAAPACDWNDGAAGRPAPRRTPARDARRAAPRRARRFCPRVDDRDVVRRPLAARDVHLAFDDLHVPDHGVATDVGPGEHLLDLVGDLAEPRLVDEVLVADAVHLGRRRADGRLRVHDPVLAPLGAVGLEACDREVHDACARRTAVGPFAVDDRQRVVSVSRCVSSCRSPVAPRGRDGACACVRPAQVCPQLRVLHPTAVLQRAWRSRSGSPRAYSASGSATPRPPRPCSGAASAATRW